MLQVSKEVAKWYKEELELEEHSTLRFYVRYGGVGGNLPGFSLGVAVQDPENEHTSVIVEGITFYVETKDAWYFEDKDLKVQMNNKLAEPVFKYTSLNN
ncbi:HesB/YadR/YfhF family protein [Oceanobacillus manasiensis]|uniref:HesB/YadR/YfhF family protein n=1 Tax=Oceanobacillus manasiensis TaxID=586413 RepID=UPI000ABA0C78|nr:hypothetical protein [Oceanobacillus manasiensis]